MCAPPWFLLCLSSNSIGRPSRLSFSPLIILIYINDLEVNIKSNVKFFADDTMLFSFVRNPSISALELNHDLQLISDWAYQWKMQLKFYFPHKNKSPIHSPIRCIKLLFVRSLIIATLFIIYHYIKIKHF